MRGKELDLSVVISPNEIFEPIRRNLHFISVAKLLRLSIKVGLKGVLITQTGFCYEYISTKVTKQQRMFDGLT